MLFVLSSVDFLLGEGWLLLAVPAFLISSLLYFTSRGALDAQRWVFRIIALFLVIRAALRVGLQYALWQAGPPGIFFLPPYQPLSYFLGYSFTHHFATLFLTLGALLFFTVFARGFTVVRGWLGSSGQRLWAPGEGYIFLSGVLLVRWPLMIPYLFLGLLAALGGLLVFHEKSQVLSLAPFFIAAALLTLSFQNLLLTLPFLKPLVMPL